MGNTLSQSHLQHDDSAASPLGMTPQNMDDEDTAMDDGHLAVGADQLLKQSPGASNGHTPLEGARDAQTGQPLDEEDQVMQGTDETKPARNGSGSPAKGG
jgi:hypothetical protein